MGLWSRTVQTVAWCRPYFDENRVQTLRLIANADPSNDLNLQTGFSQVSRFSWGFERDPKQRLTAEEA